MKFRSKSILVLEEFLSGGHHERVIERADIAGAEGAAGSQIFGDAAEELAKIGKRAERSRRRKRIRQMEMMREIDEPERVPEMVGHPAGAVALLAVVRVEPAQLSAESGLAIVVQRLNHANHI